jgi:hypothetical protein
MNRRDAGLTRFLDLIRAEYRESPGLRLTKTQIERLWRLDPVTCDAVLTALVDGRFLRRTANGDYVRGDSGDEVPVAARSLRRPRPLPKE